jgi:RNA polymerase sigma factor (sigma-70 family)
MSEAAAVVGFSRMLSDERLTRRAVGGDERAFAAIFRRYHQSLYRFCLAIVGNPEDAQDALQNTMIKVLRALPGEERQIDLKPWLYRIAHNESIDLLRRRRETRELDVEQVAPGYGLAEDVATRERLRRLVIDLKELPERQREVLVMRELAGLSFDEIGTAVGTSDAVARQTLFEARQSLRQMEEGREMNCEVVAKALSDGDGRVVRRRDVRAHLRSCADCRCFREEIQSRQHDLAALSPLPALAAAGMLQGLLGGSQAASGGGIAAILGGGAAKTVSTSAAVKGVATVAVVAVAGVTAADRSGVIHLGLPGEEKAKSSEAVPGGGAGTVDAGGQVDDSVKAGGGAKGKDGDGAKKTEGGPSTRLEANGASKAPIPSAKDDQPGRVPAPADAPGHGGSHGNSHAESHAQEPPPSDEVTNHADEKKDPGPPNPGQETAAEHKPPLPEAATGGQGKQGSPPSSPPTPKQAPANPPAGKPESGLPPQAQDKGQAPSQSAPASPPGAEVAAEKTADAGKGKGKGP